MNSPTLKPRTQVGPYEVVDCVGAGGMGEVYRARDSRLGRDVALKIVPDAFARDSDRRLRFEREARALASLNHPNIAQIHGLEDAGALRALVLEFVEGPTLADRIARAPITPDEAVAIARQIAFALEAAHERGIIHRDLKPANVKVRPDGTVKVLDFGLARAMDAGGDADRGNGANQPTVTSPAVTGLGMILGTAAYMAPEQARGKPVDRRADIWAFGCVLYEMLAGRRPFGGDDVTSTLAAVLKDAPDETQLPADLPPSLRRLLRRCLEKDPRNRLSAIGDARLELDERDEHHRPAATPPSRSPAALIGAAAAGVLVTAAAAWVFFRPPPPLPTGPSRLSIVAPADLDFFHDAAAAVISPDGRWIAFLTEPLAAQQPELWVREISGLEPRRIPGTDGATLPFWKPDSSRIGFFTRGKLNTVAVEGGRVLTVCDAPDGRRGTWNSQDVIVFADSAQGPLKRVQAGGGDPVPVTTLDPAQHESGHRYPMFLPDGLHFLFTVLPPNPQKYTVAVGGLDGTRAAVGSFEHAPTYVEPGYLLFTRRDVLVAQRFNAHTRTLGDEIVPLDEVPSLVQGEWNGAPAVSVSSTGVLLYSASPVPKTRLVWTDAAGKELERLALPPAFYNTPVISPDGTQAAVIRSESPRSSSIWLVDLAGRRDPQPVTTAAGRSFAPIWSHDGSRIFFSNDREGRERIYAKDLAAGGSESVVHESPALFKHVTSVTPDGKWLVVQELVSQTDLYLVPAGGGAKPIPLVQTPAMEVQGRISPDGRWLLYASDKSGQFELYVDAFPGRGHEVRLTTEGGAVEAIWHKDSRQVLLVSSTGLWLVDLVTGADARPGARRRIDLPIRRGFFGADVTRDFQRFLFCLADESDFTSTLTYALGWDRALRK